MIKSFLDVLGGFFLIVILCIIDANAACTTLSRNNYSANSILTSTALNADFNQLVNAHNSFDGECIQSSTVGASQLNSSDFSVWYNAVQFGCKVNYSDANTISISACRSSVNGNLVAKTTATSATWGCTNCSAEAASTRYYVYIADGSTGTTLTPLISTTAPNDDGYDSSSNKVLAEFYNNATSDIDQYTINQWRGNGFESNSTEWTSWTPTTQGMGTISQLDAKWRKIGDSAQLNIKLVTGTVSGDEVQVSLPNSIVIDSSKVSNSVTTIAGPIWREGSVGDHNYSCLMTGDDNFINVGRQTNTGGGIKTAQAGTSVGSSSDLFMLCTVPIEGWK